jgi:hypothetical protein
VWELLYVPSYSGFFIFNLHIYLYSYPRIFHTVPAKNKTFIIISWDELVCSPTDISQCVSSVIGHPVTTDCTWRSSWNLWQTRFCFRSRNGRKSLGDELPWYKQNHFRFLVTKVHDMWTCFLSDPHLILTSVKHQWRVKRAQSSSMCMYCPRRTTWSVTARG